MLYWLLAVAVLVDAAPPAPPAPPSIAVQPPRVVALGSADGGAPSTFAWSAADASGGHAPVTIAFTAADEAALPKVWIGIRLTPIPAPLAAHIGDSGVMVANVFNNSPADAAGLQQFDVITHFAGREVQKPSDLSDAVAAVTPGQPAALTVIRKGRPESATITPRERPTDADQTLKFEESPETALLGDQLKLRGRALKLGPNGVWEMKDLGSLDELQERLNDLNLKLGWGGATSPWNFSFDMNLGDVWGDDDAPKANVKVRIERQEDDGSSLSIWSEGDGSVAAIHVKRVDVAGAETEATYDTLEDLEAADPEAAALYGEHSSGAGPSRMFFFRHGEDDAQNVLKEFRIDLRERLDDAMKKAHEAMAASRAQAQAATDNLREATRRIEIKRKSHDGAESSESFAVSTKPDGAVNVIVIRDGEKAAEYSFPSMDAFKAAQPAVYEKVQGFLQK